MDSMVNTIPLLRGWKALKFKKNALIFKDNRTIYKTKAIRKKYGVQANSPLKYGINTYFIDFGSKCVIYDYKYSFNPNQVTIYNKFLFYVKNNRLVVKEYFPGERFSRYASMRMPVYKGHTKTLLYSWLRRNGFIFKKKFQKYNEKYQILSFVYPELENIFDAFPLRNNKYTTFHSIDSNVTKFLIQKRGVDKFLKLCVGNKGKIVKQILSNPNYKHNLFYTIECLNVLKGILSVEEIIEILSKSQFFEYAWTFRNKKNDIRKFFKQYDKNTIKNWLSNNRNVIQLADTVDIYKRHSKELIIPNTNSIIEIHDNFAKQERKIKDKPITFDETYKKYSYLDNVIFDSFKIEVPKDSEKLREYGENMHHCIFGYKEAMQYGRLLLLGIYKNGELKYNAAIFPTGELQQMRGKFNANPDPNDEITIIGKLKELKILNPFVTPYKAPEPVVDQININNQPVGQLLW
jgi:hypothetical protein